LINCTKYQTRIFIPSKDSIDNDNKSGYLQMLPDIYFIELYLLDNWLDHSNNILKIIDIFEI